MRRSAIVLIISVPLIIFGLFAFFVPVVPTVYPHSVSHQASSCNINSFFSCGILFGVGQTNIEGSITYFATGYGGIINPNDDYQILW